MPELLLSKQQRLLLITLLFVSISSFGTLWYLDKQDFFIENPELEQEMEANTDMTGKLLLVPELIEKLGELVKRV